MGVRGDANAAAEALAAAPFIATVDAIEGNAKGARFTVGTRNDAGEVGGDRIFEYAVQRRLVLTELSAHRESLEDVFAQLTRAESAS